jgi:glutamate racemase
LGCTHYPFIRKVIESSISQKTLLVDPADHILVDLQNWIGEIDGEESLVTYYVSGNPESFQRVLRRYFQREGDVVPVDLVDERITVRR